MTSAVSFVDAVANHWIVFQGKLLTTHAGKDGTTALKGAHPGGIKYIKHKLSADEWTFAYKGDLDVSSVPPAVAYSELMKHNKPGDCWLAIEGRVYDLTVFAQEHPGGAQLVTEHAGGDASVAYLAAHGEGLRKITETFSRQQLNAALVGLLDATTVPKRKPRQTRSRAAWARSVFMWTMLPIIFALLAAFVSPVLGRIADSSALALALAAVIALLVGMAAPRLCRPRTWQYGKVTCAVADTLAAATASDRVFYAGDPGATSEIKAHSCDMGFHLSHPPEAVVYPASPNEVAEVVKICHTHRIPVVARGAGSGLEGGAIPYYGGVVLDLMRMKSKELLADDLHARIGPGLKKSELNEWLGTYGLLFGPDPASNPSLGGMASTSGSGLSTIMYGTTRENIVSLRVVTADGQLIKTRSRVRKSSTGYDLTQLYVGSEGTLGIIVELVVKVHAILKVRTGALAVFPDISSAANAVIAIVRSNVTAICRCELLNAEGIRATNKKYQTNLEPLPTIFFEFRSDVEGTATAAWGCVEALCLQHNATKLHYTSHGDELDQLWAARRGCYLAAMTYREQPDERVYLSDTCVPISKLALMISETEADFGQQGFPCIMCAHIADGNFHCCTPYQPQEKSRVVEVERRMISRAIAMEGTVSGEHGVGVGKIAHILEEHGAAHLDVQRSIKRALDPHNILNPGKLFILPRQPGGPTDIPALYHASEAPISGTYQHS